MIKCKHIAERLPHSNVCGLGLHGGMPSHGVCATCKHARVVSDGLGDTIAKITKKIGIKPCRPCEERRRKLNQMFPYKRGK